VENLSLSISINNHKNSLLIT